MTTDLDRPTCSHAFRDGAGCIKPDGHRGRHLRPFPTTQEENMTMTNARGTHEYVPVPELEPGDLVANLGRVVAREYVGAFIVVSITHRTWSLADGQPREAVIDTVWHVADEVLVVR